MTNEPNSKSIRDVIEWSPTPTYENTKQKNRKKTKTKSLKMK